MNEMIYTYDGSFEGFLCCVFESFAQHEIPFAVWTPQRETATLYPVRDIETDSTKARRVFSSLGKSWAGRQSTSSAGIFSPGRRRKSCCSSAFCIWLSPSAPARSSGCATRT